MFELICGETETITKNETLSYSLESCVSAYDFDDNRDISGFIEIESDFKVYTIGEYTIRYTLVYKELEISLIKILVVV